MENVSKPLHSLYLKIHNIKIRGYRLDVNKLNFLVGCKVETIIFKPLLFCFLLRCLVLSCQDLKSSMRLSGKKMLWMPVSLARDYLDQIKNHLPQQIHSKRRLSVTKTCLQKHQNLITGSAGNSASVGVKVHASTIRKILHKLHGRRDKKRANNIVQGKTRVFGTTCERQERAQ